MSVRLIIGTVGSGKTVHAINIFKQFSPLEHDDSVRLILPSISDVIRTREFLLSGPDGQGMLGDPVCTLQQFASDLIMRSGTQPPKLISNVAGKALLREAIDVSQCECFDPIRGYTSFTTNLSSCISSLKAAGVTSDLLTKAARKSRKHLDESSRDRIESLLSVYSQYERLVNNSGLVELDGLYAKAMDILSKKPNALKTFRSVIIDGYIRLTAYEQEFLRILNGHVEELVITLDYDERPWLSEPTKTLYGFVTSLHDVEIDRLRIDRDVCIPSGLAHVREFLFDNNPKQAKPDESVRLLEGATPSQETDLIAEEILRLTRTENLSFSDTAVITSRGIYRSSAMARMLQRSGIPVRCDLLPIIENSFAADLLAAFCDPMKADLTPETVTLAADASSTSNASLFLHTLDAVALELITRQDENLLQDACAAWKAMKRAAVRIIDAKGMIGRDMRAGELMAAFCLEVSSGVYHCMAQYKHC